MNIDQQKQFVRELITSFPAFEDAARNSPDIGGTHRAWMRAWSDLELPECQAVLADLEKSSEISYDEYKSPGPFIRKLVLARRSKSTTSEQDRANSRLERSRRQLTGSPMARALEAALKAKRDGLSEAEALDLIDQSFPPSQPYDQPRYLCPHCHDRGLIDVWRVDSVAAYKEGRILPTKMTKAHTYRVACTCGTGKERNQPKDASKKLPFYSTGQFCRFENLSHDENLEALDSWIAEQSKGVAWVA